LRFDEKTSQNSNKRYMREFLTIGCILNNNNNNNNNNNKSEPLMIECGLMHPGLGCSSAWPAGWNGIWSAYGGASGSRHGRAGVNCLPEWGRREQV
jgi:hypothetical protein